MPVLIYIFSCCLICFFFVYFFSVAFDCMHRRPPRKISDCLVQVVPVSWLDYHLSFEDGFARFSCVKCGILIWIYFCTACLLICCFFFFCLAKQICIFYLWPVYLFYMSMEDANWIYHSSVYGTVDNTKIYNHFFNDWNQSKDWSYARILALKIPHYIYINFCTIQSKC